MHAGYACMASVAPGSTIAEAGTGGKAEIGYTAMSACTAGSIAAVVAAAVADADVAAVSRVVTGTGSVGSLACLEAFQCTDQRAEPLHLPPP